MKTFLTADQHLGEDRMELMGRPFDGKEEHIDYIRRKHNSIVSTDDLVYMLGDVCYQKTPELLSCLADFHGRKILIRGNHDRGITDEEFKRYFEQVIPEGQGIELDGPEGIPLYLTHYPSRSRPDRFNLVGHIHSAWKYQLNMLNVGVDVNHFRPINLEKIPFYLKAITEFYDNDVWVGDHSANLPFKETRGKKSVYFP
jgi:calcineurin-like phosphoesterase family protein